MPVAAAAPTPARTSATSPVPGRSADVRPCDAVVQTTSPPLTDCTVHGSPTTETSTLSGLADAGRPSTTSVSTVPPAVEPRRGATLVTTGVASRRYASVFDQERDARGSSHDATVTSRTAKRARVPGAFREYAGSFSAARGRSAIWVALVQLGIWVQGCHASAGSTV